MAKKITRNDILDMNEYSLIRKTKRKEMVNLKKYRRLSVGPNATAHFENFETMLAQVHEMLFIEKGGEEQIVDELEAYNPLVPNGKELVATILFEIDQPEQRKSFLSKLGGVEETCYILLGDEKILGSSEKDVDRTSADGKASSVQFIHFDFTEKQIQDFKYGNKEVFFGITHKEYYHFTKLKKENIDSLKNDFE